MKCLFAKEHVSVSLIKTFPSYYVPGIFKLLCHFPWEWFRYQKHRSHHGNSPEFIQSWFSYDGGSLRIKRHLNQMHVSILTRLLAVDIRFISTELLYTNQYKFSFKWYFSMKIAKMHAVLHDSTKDVQKNQ